MALSAGVDIELPATVGLRRAAARRRSPTAAIDEAVVDAAVARVLRMKFRLGLFERPYVEPPPRGDLADARGRRGARPRRTLARRSLVLVENDGILPLVAETGADRGHRADRRQRPRPARRLQPTCVHMETLARDARQRDERRSACRATTQIGSTSTSWPGRRTILDAHRDRLAGAAVSHARGGRASATATDARDRRGGRRGARTPTSRSSCSASGPG